MKFSTKTNRRGNTLTKPRGGWTAILGQFSLNLNVIVVFGTFLTGGTQSGSERQKVGGDCQ